MKAKKIPRKIHRQEGMPSKMEGSVLVCDDDGKLYILAEAENRRRKYEFKNAASQNTCWHKSLGSLLRMEANSLMRQSPKIVARVADTITDFFYSGKYVSLVGLTRNFSKPRTDP